MGLFRLPGLTHGSPGDPVGLSLVVELAERVGTLSPNDTLQLYGWEEAWWPTSD
jgi:hypothetical protein